MYNICFVCRYLCANSEKVPDAYSTTTDFYSKGIIACDCVKNVVDCCSARVHRVGTYTLFIPTCTTRRCHSFAPVQNSSDGLGRKRDE